MATAFDPAVIEAGSALVELLRGRRVVVLTGAGCSTESGIPDYRGLTAPQPPRKPMTYQEFVGSDAARVRYWARSAVGWRRIATARPNPAHYALARLEAGGVVRGIITQNVDGLHHAAGSRRVVELHGALAWVRCLDCGARRARAEFQERLVALNAAWAERLARIAGDGDVASAPDGDAVVPDHLLEGFRVPACEACGGVMKPDVVFFGENVPRERVDEAWRLFEEGEVLLVVGSSLAVYSGRRFVDRARQTGIPIGVVNLGPTRADDVAAVRVEGRVGEVLPALAAALLAEV
ncbi:MAG TPA: NAD-dependent protein deacetylase [Nannocystis sp.]